MSGADQSLETRGLDDRDHELLAAIEDGLPIVAHPYAEVAARIGMSEGEVIARLARLRGVGVLKRFGIVVRHHELGYTANAMVVWNIPDPDVDRLGARLAGFDFVTLCYRRARAMPNWPYNLYCMVHGRDRRAVLEKIALLVSACELEAVPRDVLFSRRRFKQRGARYRAAPCGDASPALAGRPG